jgi:hypothetical protein
MTVYMNESPIECIEACILEYEALQKKRAARAKWWKDRIKNFFKKKVRAHEFVETPVAYENPMH